MSAAILKRGFHPRRFLRDARGVSGIEFAFIAPVLTAMMVGVIDMGGMVTAKLDLNASVSTATAYAQMNAASVGSANGAALASKLALIVAHARGPSWADSVVSVNNGPGSSVTSGAQASSGTAAQADSCYCPSKTGAAVTWGATVTCSNACAGGGVAGKFVSLAATRQFTPIFFRSFSGPMTSSALVQTN